MKIAIIDTYYPDFLKTFTVNPKASYEEELQRILSMQFGTSDFYSRNLRKYGWEAIDVIANCFDLKRKWLGEHHANTDNFIQAQIEYHQADVVFLQDLQLCNQFQSRSSYITAAQCSCPWPGDDKIVKCDLIFTSFPHYVKRIEALGVRAVYNPLAFDPAATHSLINNAAACRYIGHPDPLKRIHDCVFIGGVGNPSHWKRGMETLEIVAREIPTFKWWGYGVETLPRDSALRAKYQGQAWGRDMYEILLRSKICLNRHGEVAEGFANNMRMYEATGCGALPMTDNQTNLFADDEIVRYSSPQDAVMTIGYYLEHEDERAAIAARGQRRTLRNHTYEKRMQKVSEVLTEMLVAA